MQDIEGIRKANANPPRTTQADIYRVQRDKLAKALAVMVATFNVAEIDPLKAFAAIEQARTALEDLK